MDGRQTAELFAGGVMPPASGAWPPPYATHSDRGHVVGRVSYPPPGWPRLDQCEYTIKLITAGLLVLALPALVALLVTRPEQLLTGVARKHVA